jgi:hypothetical protein
MSRVRHEIEGGTMTVPELNIRMARPADAEQVAALAALDSAQVPKEPLLVAEVQGRLWAALSLEDFRAVADPFRPTRELVWLLAERGRQLRQAGQRASRRASRRSRRWRGGHSPWRARRYSASVMRSGTLHST